MSYYCHAVYTLVGAPLVKINFMESFSYRNKIPFFGGGGVEGGGSL